MASTLNAIFPIAVNNLGGLDFNKASDAEWLSFARGPIDQLFYTVMYAVIMYIMATSSFKMIDLIPQQILRWMGSSATGFSDGSNAEQLTQYAAIGGTQVTRGAIGESSKWAKGPHRQPRRSTSAAKSRKIGQQPFVKTAECYTRLFSFTCTAKAIYVHAPALCYLALSAVLLSACVSSEESLPPSQILTASSLRTYRSGRVIPIRKH